MNSLDKTLRARFQANQAPRSLLRPSVPREFPSGPTSAAVKVNPHQRAIDDFDTGRLLIAGAQVDDVVAKIKR